MNDTLRKQKHNDILDCALMVFFLSLNYGAYGLFLEKYTKETVFILPMIVAGGLFAWRVIHKKMVNRRITVTVILLLLNITVTTLITDDLLQDNFALMFALVTAYFLSHYWTPKRFIDVYVKTLFFMSVWSLVASYVVLPLSFITNLDFIPLYTLYSGRPFLDMGFTMCLRWVGIARNNGFCWEPGVYQFFLLVAIYFAIEHQRASKENIGTVIVLLITLLTTFSAIAYVILPFAILIFLKKYSVNRNITIVLMVTLAACMCFAFSNESVTNEFLRTLKKWDISNQHSESLSVRSNGIIYNVEFFFRSPFWGNGLLNTLRGVILEGGHKDVTGTTILAFSAYGVFFGCVMNWCLFRFCKVKSLVRTGIWFGLHFLSLQDQNLILSFMVWQFLFLSYLPQEGRKEIINA